MQQLNESQRAAVIYTDGPALVVAGAGSGKTRVLTYKIAYLLKQGIPPYGILALTFTNKAGREMKERIASIVGDETARRLWMGTFHSVFARILRVEAQHLGYPSSFTIYDSADSKSLLKSILKEMQLDDKLYRPGMVQSRISNAKNSLVTPAMYAASRDAREADENARIPLLYEVYNRYQSRCFQAGAMDFDDLLMQTNILFRDHPEVLEKYRSHFQYILVDEYQDTNFAQHLIVQRLSEEHRRICVVGDDAQSIYSFRGANIDNILKFKNIYQGCRVFKLEQNYRSTQNIVNAANSLIDKNTEQIHKTVFSDNDEGEKLRLTPAYSDYEEGYAVAAAITEMRMNRHYDFDDFAILYRTNAQSRILEEALRKRNIPYRIYGGLSFYQRKEIKDVIAYFRVVVNPHDEEALKRIVNYPTRGIGDTTVGRITEAAMAHKTSLWNVISEPEAYGLAVNAGTLRKLAAFRELMEGFIRKNEELPANEVAAAVVKESGIVGNLFQDRSVEGVSKQENLQELIKGINEFCDIRREEGQERVMLSDFLGEVSLLTDQDTDRDGEADKVTMMTVHAAKGLEFKNVFVVGLEEDLFPSSMSRDSLRAIEEERRLFYVAITRARENCVLTYAKSRFRNGQSQMCSPSRFLHDIDPRYLISPVTAAPEEAAAEEGFTPVRHTEEGYRCVSRPSSWREPESKRAATGSGAPAGYTSVGKAASSAAASDISGLKVGAQILHDRFGQGEVLSVEGCGSDARARVAFEHFGEKQLLLKFAKFTIIG